MTTPQDRIRVGVRRGWHEGASIFGGTSGVAGQVYARGWEFGWLWIE